MSAEKFLAEDNGINAMKAAAQTSTGAATGGRIIAAGDDGFLDPSFLGPGVGQDVSPGVASEALSAGDLVNVYYVTGETVARVRKADAAVRGKEAHGFVTDAAASGVPVTVYRNGANTAVTGLTAGVQFLSATTPGKCTNVAPADINGIRQRVGVAYSDTHLGFLPGEPIGLIA